MITLAQSRVPAARAEPTRRNQVLRPQRALAGEPPLRRVAEEAGEYRADGESGWAREGEGQGRLWGE
jgi:hypothetical protein